MKTRRKYRIFIIVMAAAGIFFLFGLQTGHTDRERAGAEPAGTGAKEVAEAEKGTGEEREASESGTEALSDRVEESPGYFAALGYNDGMVMYGRGGYACWEDVLILGDTLYRMKDGIYRREGGSAYSLFGLFPLEAAEAYGRIRQYENLIVIKQADRFRICDLEQKPYSYEIYEPLAENGEVKIGSEWYLMDGKLCYTTEDETGQESAWEYDLREKNSAISKEFDCTEAEGVQRLAFYENGRFLYDALMEGNGNGGVFWQNADGGWKETAAPGAKGTIFTPKGYFRYVKDDLREALVFYDLDGNERESYRCREEGLGEGYSFRYAVYDGEELICFYENEASRQLHIYTIRAELSDASTENKGLSDWLSENARRISVTPGEEAGNILGYTFHRYYNYMEYVREPDWLVENSSVGKGIFRSEHMSETSVFLGNILRDILDKQGVSRKNREYFSQEALENLEITEEERELLAKGLKADPVRYDCSYRLNRLFGHTGYDFLYSFCGESGPGKWDWESDISVTVDSGGLIRSVDISVYELPDAGTYGYYQKIFYEEEWDESIVCNGEAKAGRAVPDFEKYWQQDMEYDELLRRVSEGPGGLLASGDGAESAEGIMRILKDVLESGGGSRELYGELFENNYYHWVFRELPWDRLPGGWKADDAWDCYMIDQTEEEGCIKFRYYIYPDFEAMGSERAEAAVMDVSVTDEGKLAYTTLRTVSLTKEERAAAKEKEGNKTALILKGEETGQGTGLGVTVPLTEAEAVLLTEYRYDEAAEHGSRREAVPPLWNSQDVTGMGTYIGDALLEDLNEKRIRDGVIKGLFARETEEDERRREAMLLDAEGRREYAGSKWKGKDEYDCYLIRENERGGCLHFRYYFYRDKPFGGKVRKIAADVYVSERGIEDMALRVLVSRDSYTGV